MALIMAPWDKLIQQHLFLMFLIAPKNLSLPNKTFALGVNRIVIKRKSSEIFKKMHRSCFL